MKINWKVRLQSKTFLVSAFALVLLLVQQVADLFGYGLSAAVSEQATAIFNTVLSILVLIGIVQDPTTSGLGDSEQALGYNKPRDDLEEGEK
ncbi:phage holin [Ureibacillus sp. 179-F W5.1 NHS]|uniref:phage holin n=1 Tax=unclassified Ureibacillus TaxID=2638520 RepID=UPI003119B88A